MRPNNRSGFSSLLVTLIVPGDKLYLTTPGGIQFELASLRDTGGRTSVFITWVCRRGWDARASAGMCTVQTSTSALARFR
jgi:hypothetical protein